MNNPFTLFDLPVDFQINNDLLSSRYLSLQKSLHPDNFAHCSPQEQRLAMQKSAEINDALQTLKDPISRADVIIAIHTGTQQALEQKHHHDMEFLMQQMAWRERLEEIEKAKDEAQLMDFSTEVEKTEQQFLSEISTALSAKNWQEAAEIADKLRFVRKLTENISQLEEKFFSL